jgi:hypothetical protein
MGLDEFFKDGELPVQQGTDLSKIYNYLQSRRSVPMFEVDNDLRDTTTQATYDHRDNTIRINPNARSLESTIPHEMTHAAQEQMGWQWLRGLNNRNTEGNTGLDRQYVDAYEKLHRTPTKLPSNGINPKTSLPYLEGPKEERYRTGQNEREAFGMGNMQLPDYVERGFPMPPHYDATAASEHSILLELAQRAAQQQRQSSPSFTQTLKNLFR